MAGLHGVEEIKKIVLASAEALNVLSKIAHKQGIFVAFQLSDELMELGSLDPAQLKNEISELDPHDREELKKALKEKLVLLNKEIEAKLEASADLLDSGVDIALEGVELVKKGIELALKAKALFQ
jgi:DNA-directed RNA polymerase subunit F